MSQESFSQTQLAARQENYRGQAQLAQVPNRLNPHLFQAFFPAFGKPLLAALLFFCCAAFAFPQVDIGTRPRLGILPFTGGTGGDGETIATLLSHQREIMDAFTVVPRTSAVNDIFAEQYFQLTGLTDQDTIARIGGAFAANYVISGNIRRLGNRNLVIATMVNVETFEQVAGYYRMYRNIGEVRGFLPSMARAMANAALGRDRSGLPSLAIGPFSAGLDTHDAETLAQILAIEILNTGKYAVLTRTSTMQAALREHEFQMRGHVADEELVSFGRAGNADLVLSAVGQRLGDITMFTAQIFHVEEVRLIEGATRDYRVIADGIDLMAEIAILLTDPGAAPARIAELHRRRSRAALFGDTSRFWSLGVSAGTSFAAPWLTGTVQATLAPLPHSFVRIGCDLGFVSGVEGVGYFLIYPFVHYALFLPFDMLPLPFESGGWHIGIGGGFLIDEHRFDDFTVNRGIPAADFITGVNIGNVFDISYTLRTNFSWFASRVSVGFTHRFQTWGR